ncbi:MAG: FAD-binding protein [Nitrospiraceae bacterium]|nr:FAD-binding protein [Nitrospiraceae bacterium]
MSKYGEVTSKIVARLKQIVGERNVIYGDADQLESYSHDETGGLYTAMPNVVVKPTSTEQVSEVMKLANREKIPVTPRGAGSGLAGGAIPLYGGIVLSCEKMDRILEIDKVNLVAVVEPGVITNDLCRRAAEEGLFYAGYPMSVELSFVGGNVACNAGGAKVVKYGTTAAHVLGLEVVLPTGEVIKVGGKRRKDSSGYSLLRLFVGSEGTLGIFTKIYLNLIPEPGKVADLLVPFGSVKEAIYTVPKIMTKSKILPVAVEFIDRLSVRYCSEYTNSVLPYQDDADAYLIVQLDGKTKENLQDTYENAGNTCLENGALEVFVADNKFASEKIWNMRRNWLEALKAADPYVSTGDVVVPLSEIPQIMEKIDDISKTYGVQIPCAGHAADGNIHPAPMKPADTLPSEWKSLMEEILGKIAVAAGELGGAVSGEHGIGFVKKELLSKTKAQEVEVMRRIKAAFDPNNILNPGKLF